MDFFNDLYPEKAGALQAPNMRFLLSIPGGKGKPITKGTAVILIIAVMLVIITLTAVAAFLGSEHPCQLGEYMKPVSESIGDSRDAVFTVLSDNGLGLIEVAPDIFAIPGGYALPDVKLEVLLHFEQNEGLLDGYSCVTRSKIKPKEAAKVIKDVLGEYYSDVVLENGKKVPLKIKALTDMLSGTGTVAFRDSVDVTPQPESGTAVAKYIEYLQSANYWKGRLREYLIKTANYYRDIEVIYTPATQILELKLSYQVEADRG